MLKLFVLCFLAFPYCLKGFEEAFDTSSTCDTSCKWTVNDIVRIVLENQKEIQISYENIEVQAGLARQSAAPFDLIPNLQYNRINSKTFQFTTPPPERVKLSSFDSQMVANLNKTFRLGTIISASGQINNIRTTLRSSPPGIGYGSLTGFPTPNYQLTFQIQQPLLRHFIYGLDVMNEKAQILQIDVARNTTIHFVSDRITNAVTFYWEVVAAKKLIEIHQKGEQEYLDLIEKVKGLIKGEQIAAGDIVQPEAQLGQERANLFDAYLMYNLALQNLKFSMGIGDQCTGCEEKLLTEEFPPIQESQYDGDQSCHTLMKVVRSLYPNRQDITALEINEASAELRLIGSRNETLPELDIFGTYNASKTRQSSQPVRTRINAYQKVVTIGVSLTQPLNNDFALGLVRQRRAERIQAALMTKLLKEEMSINFFQLWKNHFLLVKEVREARIAVELYDGLIKSETKKLNAGFSTVFVIIDFQRQLIQAEISLNEAYKNYAQNIVQYRFVTGTLLKVKDGRGFELDVEPLTEWPRLL